MLKFGLRAKIILIAAIVVLLAIGSIIASNHSVFVRENTEALQSRSFAIGTSLKVQLERVLQLGIDLDDVIGFEEQCREVVATYEGIDYALVASGSGKILFHNDVSLIGQQLKEPALVNALQKSKQTVVLHAVDGSSIYSAVVPVSARGIDHTAAVIVGFSPEQVARKAREMAGFSLGVGLLILAAGILLLVGALSVSITQPLAKLIATVEQIRGGRSDMVRRVDVRSTDEIGQLASAFNHMAERIDGVIERERELAAAEAAARESARRSAELQAEIELRKKTEHQLFQSQKMEALGNLAGGIAHDFNNMLLPILALTELTMLDLPEDHDGRENLSAVIEAARHAQYLVQQVLTFSRQDESEIAEIEISSSISDALSLLRSVLPSTITMIEAIDTNVGIVLADKAQISSIVMNLGSNAADAMAGKVGELEVKLTRLRATARLASEFPSLKDGSDYARLTMRDTGCGMDHEMLEKIFNPFFTTKPVGEGTGLGLAMVHGIVNRFDGVINVQSTPGVGSTFEVFLPLASSDATQPLRPSRRGTLRTPEVLHHGLAG